MKKSTTIVLISILLLQMCTGFLMNSNGSDRTDITESTEPLGGYERDVSDSRSEDGLVGQWHFDEGRGETVADSSGNENHATHNNMNYANWVDGRKKSGLEFDGVDDYIDCGNDESLNPANEITIEFWMKPFDDMTDGIAMGLIYKGSHIGGNCAYSLYIYNSRLYFHTNVDVFNSGIQTWAEKWYHIAVIFNDTSGDGKIYRDGIVLNTVAGSDANLQYVEDSLKIGDGTDYAYFSGIIDEVSIYTYALSTDEIKAHYHSIHIEQDEFGGSWFDDFEDESGIDTRKNIIVRNGEVFPVGADFKGWDHSSIIAMENKGAEELLDYQVKVIIPHKAGMNVDFSDLRFTYFYPEYGENEICYWVEKYTEGNSADIWLNISRLRRNTVELISMYYGKEGTSSCSDIIGTFVYGKDFNNCPIEVNPNGWYSIGAQEYSQSWVQTTNDPIGNDPRILMLYGNRQTSTNTISWIRARTNISIPNGEYIFECKYARNNENDGSKLHFNANFYPNNPLRNGEIPYWDMWYNLEKEISGPTTYLRFENYLSSDAKNGPAKLWIDDIRVRKNSTSKIEITYDAQVSKPVLMELLSKPIDCPENMNWNCMSISKTLHSNAYINISIIDDATNQTIPGYENLTARNIDISSITADSIRLKAWFSGDGQNTPSLDSWGVEWTAENAWRDSFVCDSKVAYPYGVDEHTVGYWRFDEGSGNVVRDLSRNGNDGNIYSAEWSEGKFGGGLRFDGEDDYVSIPHNSTLSSNSQTVEVWYKPKTSPPYNNYKGLIYKSPDTSVNREFSISVLSDGTIKFSVYDGVSNGWGGLSSSIVTADTWYHVALVKIHGENADTFQGFVNGIIEVGETKTWHGVQNSNEIILGKTSSSSPPTAFYNGTIDEVRISKIARTADEISQTYQAGISILGRQVQLPDNEIVPDRNTSALWHFNEGEGNTIRDSSGNGNDGVIYGANWTDGVMGDALEFDGGDDYVDVGDIPSSTQFSPNTISIEAWIYPKRNTNYILGRSWYNSNFGNYAVFMSDGKLGFGYWSSTSEVEKYLLNNTISLNQWNFFSITYSYGNGDSIKIFINGISQSGSWIQGDGNSLPSIESSSFEIGHWYGTPVGNDGYWFNGIIDELAIYDRTLTLSEIYNHSRLYSHNATLRSEPIALPEGYSWSDFHFSRIVPGGTYLNITVHDTATGEILLTDDRVAAERTANLSLIDARVHPSVYLEANFRSNRTKTPVLYDWAVSWKEMMPPHQIDDIDTVFIDEDIPQYNLLDLSSYFHDPYSSIEHSIYSVDYISDESNITLIINGSFLDITHLAENWTGNVYVVVNCTNMYGLATSSNKFKITVSNVNDPPQVFLVSPKDGALLNRTDVTLSWQGIDVDAELTTFEYDLFFGKTENPELFISNLVVTNITITDLENGMTYYWYIVPDDRELEGICLNGTWNFTINLQQIPTEVILHSPLNGTTVNPNEVNLTWGVRNETEESPLFHIYIGSNEYNIAEIGTTENMWYVLGDLQKDSLYYWYVVPSVGTSYGICSSGIWHFNVDLSFIAVYDITVESDVDRLEISHGNGTVFNITLTNIGNALTTVSLTPYGPISGFVNMSRNLTLPIQTSKTIPVVIDNIALFPEGTYEFTIEILHPGGTETFLIPVNITSWKPAGGADDTDDDIPDSRGTSKELWEDNQLLFVLGIIAAFVTASIVILLVIKRKKRKQPPHEDHYPTDGEAVSARVDVPPAVDVSPPQYYSNIQYPQSDDRTYESPPVQPNEPVHPTDESSFPSETIPDIQPKYPSDYYGPEHQEPVPEPVPSSSVGEAQSMLFTTYEAVKCSICLGYIKNGAQAFKCACSKIFHPTCGARTGMCPICQRTITSEDVGLSEPETPTTKVIPKIIPVDEPLNVNWRSDPRILGASEDFNISDIFLIGLDGLLIRSMSFSTSVREGTDQDIMTGMLTAVTDFIRDSFRDEMGGLKTLQYGRMTIYLERGVTFYLVTVFRGEPPEDLRRRMRGGLIQLWERYKHYLKAWDGTAEGLEGIDNCLMESLGLQPPLADEPDNEGDDYQPPKFTGDILTSEPGEGEMPNAVTTADLSTQQGCYHLYNMLLAKKGSDIRIGPESPKTDINKARKQIIMMYHPDRWQTDSDKANFFMKKVNVAWEILSKK